MDKFVIGDAGVAVEDREEAERRRVLAKLKQQVRVRVCVVCIRVHALSALLVAIGNYRCSGVHVLRLDCWLAHSRCSQLTSFHVEIAHFLSHAFITRRGCYLPFPLVHAL